MGFFMEFMNLAKEAYRQGYDEGQRVNSVVRKSKEVWKIAKGKVKLTEPCKGRIVTFVVICAEADEYKYVNLLADMAKNQNADVSVSGNIVTIIYENYYFAREVRKIFK